MSVPKKRILFLTGTRADFGKLKPLIAAVEQHPAFDYTVFATGMHTLKAYGYTIDEVRKAGFKNVYEFMNQVAQDPMDMVLAETITGLARWVHQHRPDMIVVHGDRIEAMAGAIVGALRDILVAHIEGGELSGTVDELIRHSVSKLAHVHFVANEDAATRLRQMGENQDSIFVIGSPDIDVMCSDSLPTLDQVRQYYDIPFERYGVAMFHSVTSELDDFPHYARQFTDALIESGYNYVVVYPNNDEGSVFILNEYKRLRGLNRFRVFPSLRFEYFLTMMKNAMFVVGNSSAGIREAPFYGRPSVNVGTRQNNRFPRSSIINVGYSKEEILAGIVRAEITESVPVSTYFGDGRSRELFMAALTSEQLWRIPRQKVFVDIATSVFT